VHDDNWFLMFDTCMLNGRRWLNLHSILLVLSFVHIACDTTTYLLNTTTGL
jgi:hypothetical protein